MSDAIREAFEAWWRGWSNIAPTRQGEGYAEVAENVAWTTWQAALQSQTAPAPPFVAVPEGMVLMPSELTAENGAKYLLSGEFSISVEHQCSACAYHDVQEDCEVCGGEIDYTQSHLIPWSDIKDIYGKAVALLAAPQPDHIADAGKVVQGKNRYGLDMGYFARLITREFGDLRNFRPDEFARVCARMAATADASVLQEKEFHATPSVPEGWHDDARVAIRNAQSDVSRGSREEYYETIMLLFARRILSLTAAPQPEPLRFSDTAEEIEERLVYLDENACPHCGGSGHKDDAAQPDHSPDAGKVVQGEPVAWAVFADNGNLRIWGREKPKSFPGAVPLYLCPTVKDSLTAESLAQLDSEDQKGMERIVEAVAHIGIDFGYGTYELEQCHIDRAREIKESLDRLRASQQEGGE